MDGETIMIIKLTMIFICFGVCFYELWSVTRDQKKDMAEKQAAVGLDAKRE